MSWDYMKKNRKHMEYLGIDDAKNASYYSEYLGDGQYRIIEVTLTKMAVSEVIRFTGKKR